MDLGHQKGQGGKVSSVAWADNNRTGGLSKRVGWGILWRGSSVLGIGRERRAYLVCIRRADPSPLALLLDHVYILVLFLPNFPSLLSVPAALLSHVLTWKLIPSSLHPFPSLKRHKVYPWPLKFQAQWPFKSSSSTRLYFNIWNSFVFQSLIFLWNLIFRLLFNISGLLFCFAFNGFTPHPVC